jgi:hypothetical protein
MSNQINIGDVWKRRTPVGDNYDSIRVCAMVDHAGFRPNEWMIRSATADFSDAIQTEAAGILNHCDRVSSGDPECD